VKLSRRLPTTFRALFNLFMAGVVAFSFLLQAGGVSASPRRDDPPPDSLVNLTDSPGWLDKLNSPDQLYSEYPLETLAGKLILYGVVTIPDCPGGGLLDSGLASKCGVQAAMPKVIEWQNRFNSTIITASQQTGVPPLMLKNIFAWESQFWPQTVFVNTSEYGLGHLTEMGADSVLRWNYTFYQSICRGSFAAENCDKYYVDQPSSMQSALRGVVLQKVNADCGNCTYGLDLKKAEDSVPTFATTLLANQRLVKIYIQWFTSKKAADVVGEGDLWRFTLASYNAGPGCFKSALAKTSYAGKSINWDTLSSNFDPACRGAKAYVDFVSSSAQYFPDHAPSNQPTPAATEVPLETITNVPTVLATPEATSTSETVTDAPTVSATPEVATSPTVEPSATETNSPTTTVDATGTPEPSAGDTATPQISTFTPTAIATEPAIQEPSTATATLTEPATLELSTSTPTATAPETTTPEPPTATPTEAITGLPTEGPQGSSNELVVKFKSFPASLFSSLVLSSVGATVEQTVDSLGAVVVSVPDGQVAAVLDQLNNNLLVDYAEPNSSVQVFYTPNDPGFAQQSNALTAMQIPDAWDITRGSGALVAVIDTGVDTIHPDLSGALWNNPGETGLDANGNDKRTNGIDDDNDGYVDDWQGWNFVAGTNNPGDDNGHGTHITSIIAGRMDNNLGITGVAPQAQVMALKALDAGGHGTYASVAEAIFYAVDHGARIINLGFGGTDSSQVLLNATNYAFDHDVLVIAAGGNTGDDTVFYPAANPDVIGVSALDGNLDPAVFSSYGDHISLSAPGVNVYGTLPGSQYGPLSGTSMSAAEVSGVTALLASLPKFATAASIREALIGAAYDLGTPGWDAHYGYGLVHALDAMNYVPGQMPTPTASPTPDASPTPITPPGDGGVSIMAIGTSTSWAHPSTGAAGPYTIPNAAFSCGAGTNRLLVAIVTAATGNTAATPNLTATKGTGINFTTAVSTTTASRVQVWIGYLTESQINGNTNNISITNIGTAWTGSDVYLSCYNNVYQGQPLVTSGTWSAASNNNGAGSTSSAMSLPVVDGGVIVYGNANENAGPNSVTESAVNPVTPAWTEPFDLAGTGYATMIGQKQVTGATTPVTTTFNWAAARFANAAISLNPGAAPTLTSPTATSITDTTATLGATINTSGSSAITARGTCWGTTAAPATNCAAEGGTTTGVFTQARTGLPAGTRIFYRGYATNSFDTGYSPDGSFYTEPATQASSVNFTAVGATGMSVNWTRGTGTDVIVLMKASSAVSSDPLDGTYTAYTANSAFGSGTQIGTGNYVIYKGTGTSVSVTNLVAGTAYHVAVYEYAGSVDTAGVDQGTNYKLFPAIGSQLINTPPVVTITAPANNSTYAKNTPITFTGTAIDAEDGDISAGLIWYSDLTGPFGTGASVLVTNLLPGTHVITAQSTDTNGAISSAFITVTITPLSGPHGGFNGSTDQCAQCHRAHSAKGSDYLTTDPNSVTTSDSFCLSCHPGVSTHSNKNWTSSYKTEPDFEIRCVQCHDPHGNSNLFDVKTQIETSLSPFSTVGPVTFTSLTGANSFDDGTSTNRLCVVCHTSTTNHPGGDNHYDASSSTFSLDYTGQSCVACHPHNADTNALTLDGFMPVRNTNP
jgi:thermitase